MTTGKERLVRLIEREIRDERVAGAFARLDRADFVPDRWNSLAYQDRPVALPQRQTTSQPSLIARMVEAAALGADDRALEIGTGYGFQTALMASLAREVVSIERHAELAEAARENLRRAGFTNVSVVVGDGWQGLSEKAPFDAIVVSAAADRLPAALIEQLADGGRIVIPLARAGSDDVVLLVRRGEEVVEEKLITPARFVPLVRDVGSR